MRQYGGGNTADISLNGIFTLFEAARTIKNDRKLYFPYEYASDKLKHNLITENETQVNPDYPFMKKRTSYSAGVLKDVNFAVIILESFDRDIMDKYPQAVPFFTNHLKKNGIYFTNTFASGRRSLMGLSSLMLSVPYIQGLLPLNSGLETKEFMRIGNILNKYGYHTLYIANENPNDERISELINWFGINEFYSKRDIPLTNTYPEYPKGYDLDALEFWYKKLNDIQGRFVSYFWTASTHLPYHQILSEELKIFAGKDMLEQYLNRLRYTDYALENFFKKAENEKWFKNTVFILVPDHRAVISGRKPTRDDIGEEYFASFMLFYAPDILVPSVNETYCNIGDIIPTIFDLAHIGTEYASFYTSLFDSSRKNQTFVYGEDNKIYVFAPDYRSIIDINQINPDNMTETDKTAAALGELLYITVKNNKFMKK